jgi:FemAB-related protein (PEP-CTERM system-associated)
MRADGKIQVRPYAASDRKAWDLYVKSHPDGTFFHQIGWKELVEGSFHHQSEYLVAEAPPLPANGAPGPSAKQIVGIFPLFSIKSLLFGRSMVSVPFGTYGGILADNDEVEQALYARAVELTQAKELDYLEVRNEGKRLAGLPTKDLYYNFKKEISPDNDENLKAIPRKTRRMVRKGMSNGFDVAMDSLDLLDTFYELFALSYSNLGTPVFSKRYIRKTLEEFNGESSILIIFKDKKPLSGVLSFYFKDQVIPYYSGAHPDSREQAANDYMYWALMSHAAERGYRTFDFGRSKKGTGPFDFKRHWGFEPNLLPYQFYLNNVKEIPNISPANPKYRKQIEVWKKLPLWAAQIIGPAIVKYIP